VSPQDTPAEPTPDLQLEIAHVLLIDVVSYSKLLVNEQIELLQELKQIVRSTESFHAAEARGELIRVPTGDGMALVFFHSPEEPARCALEISKALQHHPHIQLRMGVHSGPVNRVIDVNEKTNIAGSGINVAQRVLDCGDAGHILLSKHVAEDLAEYRHWQPHLHDLGECEVKYGLHLHLFNLFKDGLGNPQIPEKLRRGRRKHAPAVSVRPVTAPRWSKGELLVALIVSAVALVISSQIFLNRAPSARVSRALSALAAIPEKSIAVLPFENLSNEKENAFFADGVQDEILTDLGRIADLKVISRTSAMQYKSGVARNLREIGRQLGVAHVMEGSVQRAGNRVRVNAQLVDARTDKHLWAETYDRDLADMFAIQSEIAKAIAEQLKAKLSPQEKARVEEIPTKSTEAYLSYLQANQLERNPDTMLEDYKAADQLYMQAIELDPNFALAHARLASLCAEVFHYYEPTESWRTKARSNAEIALRLQSNLAEAHFALGQCIYWMEQDYDRALEQFEIASRLSPSNGDPDRLIAAIKRRQGKWQEALEAYERVVNIDPQNPNTVREVLFTNTAMRRWPEAARWGERMRVMAPASLVAKMQTGYVDFWWKGDTARLKSLVEQVPTGVDPDGAVTSCRWDVAMLRRDYSAARNILQTSSAAELSYTSAGTTPKSFFEGCIYLAQGDNLNAQKAFELARSAFEAAVREAPASANRHANLGCLYAFMGRREDAIREGRRAVELNPESKDAVDGPLMNGYLALIYARVGEKELAISLIERLLKTPGAVDSADYSITVNDLKYRWEWDPLRGDLAFQKLCEEKQL
jgi:TolB-like protein/class 3 adenylate cyclase/Tfp pilus assembly protein PilF